MSEYPATETETETVPEPAKTASNTGRWLVRLAHPDDRKRVVFSSVSEQRARNHVVNKYPRGTTAYLEGPDGRTQEYAAGRLDPDTGIETDEWADFDPDSYSPSALATAPGNSEWADTEG